MWPLSDLSDMKAKFSFDIIGDIAVVEAGSVGKEMIRHIRETYPFVKTILEKEGDRRGKYRTRKFRAVYGTDTRTTHKEYGMQFSLDVAKTYFSPRESTERQRIAGMVKPKETVLVMFAGVGPYAVAIARRQQNVGNVYAIEINPIAVKHMEENVRINKAGDKIIPILGDVTKKAKRLYGKCNRVIMPLPLEAEKFLPIAIKCLKKKGTIHFYSMGPEHNLFHEAEEVVKKACKKAGVKCRILNKHRVLPYGPRKFKVCVDFGAKRL